MKKTLALILTFIMVLALVPTVAFAEEPNKIYVDANNGNDTQDGVGTASDKAYKSLDKAMEAAVSGDTIMLGEGKYTLYGVSSDDTTKGKNLTFVGQGANKTGWNIGAEVPDPANFGTEYNGDYSFDGAGTITFRNMTLQSGAADYLGFIRADNTIVENCTVNGKTFYWGYKSAKFTNTTFNCPTGDYALWTYSSPTMTFDNCTFNSTGKIINVYTDAGAGKNDITVNFNNCTVINTDESLKPVLNINDSNMGDFKYILNITGDNKVSGVDVDKATCSRLFGFGGKAETNNKGKTVVNIDDKTVWKDGSMVGHPIDTTYDKYTDGYKDNAFDVTYGEWSAWNYDTRTRTFTKICKYCGYKEEGTEKETRIVEHHDHYYPTTTPVPVIVIPPKTGDMTVWQSILHFLGIR